MGARFYAFAHRESKRERKEARGGLLFISQTGFVFARVLKRLPHTPLRAFVWEARPAGPPHTHTARRRRTPRSRVTRC